MGWWTEHVVPRLVDRTLDDPTVRGWRERTCAGLHGQVLEIGFGSGLNVPHYPAAVQAVSAVEPSEVGWRLAQHRLEAATTPVRRTGMDGQRLELPDASMDSVLSTFTLCTIPDAASALAEVARVLRPGGSFHFLEHGLAPDAGVARWQRRLEPVQRRVAGGCHLTRQMTDLVAASGLAVLDVDNAYFPGPVVTRPFGYVYLGRARRP
jgi:ubiquinone/menaquinone biosynthesis C-methylase UbiE